MTKKDGYIKPRCTKINVVFPLSEKIKSKKSINKQDSFFFFSPYFLKYYFRCLVIILILIHANISHYPNIRGDKSIDIDTLKYSRDVEED